MVDKVEKFGMLARHCWMSDRSYPSPKSLLSFCPVRLGFLAVLVSVDQTEKHIPRAGGSGIEEEEGEVSGHSVLSCVGRVLHFSHAWALPLITTLAKVVCFR